MNVIVKNIPNTITCLNVASGVMAILLAGYGSETVWGMEAYRWAWIFVGIAAVMDFLDGFAARALHAYSNLGKELDSLCDAVSFGVAPAVILFYCMDQTGSTEWMKWLVPIIPVAGVLRLAKFNIDTRQTTSFIGLPIPANAIFWIGYTALCYEGTEFLCQWYWFLLLLLFESWLMVSPLKLFSLKFKNLNFKENVWRYLLIVTAIVFVCVMGVPGLMWLIVAYVLYGLFAAQA